MRIPPLLLQMGLLLLVQTTAAGQNFCMLSLDDQEQENCLIDGIYLATRLLLVLPFGVVSGGIDWFLRRGQTDGSQRPAAAISRRPDRQP